MQNGFNQDEIDAILRDLAAKNGQEGDDKGVGGDHGPESFSPGERETGPLVEKVEFAQLKRSNTPAVSKRPDLNLFGNIPLILSGELGKAVITVRDLLKLKEGSIIRLEKMVGESAAMLLNDEYLGQAEIVVINDRFGLRITALGDVEEKETGHAKETQAKEAQAREMQAQEIKAAEEQAASAQSASAAAGEGGKE